MISICIPVYNFQVVDLVETLRRLADQLTVPVEIILIDDASDPDYVEANKQVASIVNQYHLLPGNIGRSRIRNRFLEYASYEYCLFLDCDVIPSNEEFLSAYALIIQQSPTVMYGGRIFPVAAPNNTALLRWKYGTKIESKPASIRQADPYRYFHSNNFLIRKSILQKIQFDESLTGYGYEDSLFSYQLQNCGITVTHIDNPVLNLHIETTEKYLENIDNSLQSLVTIQRQHDIGRIVRLVKMFNQYKWLFSILPAGLVKSTRTKLLKGALNLRLLQLYKMLQYKDTLAKQRFQL